MSSFQTHEPNLCCALSPIGKLYDKDICKQCLKDIINGLPNDDHEAVAILSLLNEFNLRD